MRLERPKPLVGRPSVSVVIPCYNYGHYLPETLRSAIDDQPDVDVDVCIVDDASPDGSGQVAAALAEDDPRITVLQHATNRGHIQTYNDGLERAQGEFVVLLSADDLLAPGALGRATALMEAHPSVGFTYGFVRYFNEHPPATTSRRVRSWGVWSGDDWLKSICRRGGTTIVNPEVVMRRQILAELGGYDPALPQTADMAIWLQAAQLADVGRVNGPDQAFYRQHGANMHLNEFAGVITDVKARAATVDYLFSKIPKEGESNLHQISSRAIAFEALDIAAAAYDQGRSDTVPVDEFVAIAEHLWPPITRTIRWRLLIARQTSASATPWMPAASGARTLRHKIRWRRWARYGI